MARCSLCKTQYPDGVSVCKIDGTSLVIDRTASVLLPSLARRNQMQELPKSGMQSVMASPRAAGKGRVHDGLASMTEEVTTAAKPESLAARARDDEDPPRIATGSGTVAPKNKQKDAWSAPFLDQAPVALDSQNSEEWVGQTLGSYKLISILGKGGMGCVYRAEHTKLGREVALKVLRSDYAMRRDAVARFFQEARAVNRVRHRNIVDITDLVELDVGIVFIIMEYLEGVSLTRVMRSSDVADPVRTLGLLVQICDGLAAAHSVGIVHRDLKPDNIIVCKEGEQDQVKLLDFGVAKLLDKDEDDDFGQLTVAGSVVGTPAFMSPEQAGGLQVDGRADIYSLGAIMYEMFAKQPLFRGKSFGEYVRMHLTERPTPPSQTAGGHGINPRIEEVIMMCLEKSPDARFQTAHELRAELLSLLSTYESSGELTAHLAKHEPSAMPVGDAFPKRTNVSGYPPQPPAHPGRSGSGAEMRPYYQRNSDSLRGDSNSGIQHPPNQQILVSRSSEAMQVAGYPNHTPGHTPLYTPNMGYSPGTPMPMAGYSDAQIHFSSVGNTSVHSPPVRNYRGVGIGIGIGLAAVIALVVATSNSSETGPKSKPTTSANTKIEKPGQGLGNELVINPDVTMPDVTTAPNDRFVIVALRSEPSAQVFAVGAVLPVCQATPCELRIDTTDGGSTSRRDYIMRSDHHEDSTITIDLRAPREEIAVTLEPIRATPEAGIVTPIETGKHSTTNKSDKPVKKSVNKVDKSDKKPKCKVGAQDTFNPFGENEPCQK